MIPGFLFEDSGGAGDSCCRGSREEEADEDKKGEWALGKENGCGLGL